MSASKLKSCCIVGCKNQNIGADSGVIFYKFPEERKLKTKWVEACKKNDALKDKKWEPPVGAVICNVHFVSGQKSPHDWHPDYVPSVFRSLRRNIVKKKGRFFDDSDDESTSRPRLKTPTVKRLQSASSAKRVSLSTPSTSKGKGATPTSLKKGRPPSTGGLRKPLRLTKKVKAGPKSRVLKKEEIIDLLDSPLKSPQSSNSYADDEVEEEADDKSNVPVFAVPENKRKHLDDDFEDDPGTPLKTLSVVLERTSEKKIKLTTGEITIKEEPLGDVDYILPQKITPITKKIMPSSPKITKVSSKPLKLPSKPVAKFRKSPLKDQCKNCAILTQKVLDLEANAVSNKVNEKCQRCPVIEHELKKVEEELEDIIESKLSKCQRCSLVEQKCKRVENNLRKAQTELSKVQSKLANIEICEETFKKYKSKVKLYTGFPNFDSLMLVFDHVRTRLPPEPSKGMSHFQMFILVMMRLKLNLPFWDLTYRFGASPNNIQAFYPLYIDILESTLSHVVLWPKANMQFRLQVLGSNLRQSFLVIQSAVKEETLMMPSSNKMSEGDKVTRVCAALYHIAQLVSSNHSQQLVRILKSKDDLEKKPTETSKNDETPEADVDTATPTMPNKNKKAHSNGIEEGEKEATLVMNGEEDVDDSDIFFEDFTKDISAGVNSNDSLELECKHLRKELNNISQKLSCQFKFYTGLKNFEVFNSLLSFLEPHVSHIKTDKMSHFQQLHLVLTRYKLSLDVQDLAYMFNVDTDQVVYLTRVWTDVMSQNLKRYIDWPTGIEDAEGEKRLLGTVKLKYHMLWKPQLAPRNRDTNRDKEKLDMRKLLRACAAVYSIDDIEVFTDGVRANKITSLPDSSDKKSNEELESDCLNLRSEIYDLRKHIMSCISSCLSEDSLQNNDQMVRYYTGFPSFEVLKNIFNLIFPTTKPENRKTISPFQQFLALLVRLKLNISTHDIAYRFGMGQSNTHKLIQDWLVWLHTQLGPHITWPDDDEDVEVFTEMLRKTYAYLKNSISPRKNERRSETGFFDIATLVCAGLYNVGEVSFNRQSGSEVESFDEDW